MLHAVIMAGGSGTRFWPQSRRDLPKQLLRLAGPETMIQATIARLAPAIPAVRTWLVTGARLAAESMRQLPQLPDENVLREPCGRNTAPCVGLAALHLLRRDPGATMLVVPADHVISPAETFQQDVARAVSIVEAAPQSLVLFGVKPTYPATGYGYIEQGKSLDVASETGAFQVARFREKPDRATAATYIESGTFLWNCGIFVWKAGTIVGLLDQFEPAMMERLRRIVEAEGSPDAAGVLSAEFPQVKSISIDYAVLERAGNVCVLPARFEWDDVGSWQSLERLLGQDADRNTVDGPFAAVNTSGCIVRTTSDHLVTAIGVENLIIVHTPDATLVARKDDENSIRKLIEVLEQRGYANYL